MENFTQRMEEVLVPFAMKLNANRYLSAIRDGFVGVMSFLIIGSMFLLVANFPIPGYADFMAGIFGAQWSYYITIPFGATMAILTLYVTMGIARSLAISYELDEVSAVYITLVAFIILTPMLSFDGAEGISTHALGAEGLFLGIITAIVSVELLNYITKKGWEIKMPETVPENVSRSFSTLIPATLIIIFFLLVRIGFALTSYETLQNFIFTILQTPLLALWETIFARLIVTTFEQVLWIFGLHGPNIAGSVMTPVYQTLTNENAANFLQGLPPTNIMTLQFHEIFVKIGGSGGTLPLAVLMIFTSKSDQYRELGKLSLAPGLFNINEPIIFGLPIVLSPIMAIPFIIAPIVTTIITYLSMKSGIVPITSGVNIPWTTPPIIGGFLVSGVRGSILQIVNLLVGAAIYFPFFKMVDGIAYREQKENLETL